MIQKIRQLYQNATMNLRSSVDFQMSFLLYYASFVHCGFVLLSIAFSQYIMTGYYLLTIGLFCLFAKFIDSKRFLIIYIFTYIEISVHIYIGYRIIGNTFGVELYYILLIPVGCYILFMQYSRLFQIFFLVVIFFCNAGSYIAVHLMEIYSRYSVHFLPSTVYIIFFLYTVFMVFFMAVLQSYFFIRSILNQVSRIKEENSVLNYNAKYDALTGLYNRREMDARLSLIFSQFVQNGIPCSVCIGDIDNFKVINDTYGHLAGDFVLKTLAQLMQVNIRKSDFLSRWGGEEFLLLMQADASICYRRAEQLREKIAGYHFSFNGITIPVTITFGVAGADAKTSSVTDLIDAADRLLYQGKKNGRNQTVGNKIK